MFNKIKQLKDLRDQANTMKQALAQETVSAEADHGRVSLVMDGNQEVLAVSIAPELLQPEKKEEVEKAVKEAANDAVKKSQRAMAQKIQGMGGLNLPGMGL
jgi:nucleoid-associated protein EbfC